MNFNEKLKQSAEKTGSIACMGLDPVLEATPDLKPMFRYRTEEFLETIFTEMLDQKVLPGAFKPNEGFYNRHDLSTKARFPGSTTLSNILKMIRNMFPGIPVILDNKRGDIGTSSANYAKEGQECWEADAVTVHPYMGFDSVLPFAGRNPKNLEEAAKYCNDEQGKGVYVLTRTSNPGAKDFQDLEVNFQGTTMPLYMVVAHKVIDWAEENPGLGAVVGATYPEELSNIAELFRGHSIPLLIPGAGGQGGKADEVVARLKDADYDLSLARINSSSGTTHPWIKAKKPIPTKEDFAKICVEQVYNLNEEIGYKKIA